MIRKTGKVLAFVCAAFIPFLSGIALATDPPVKMSIREPVRHSAKGGFAEGRDWNLEFRMAVQNPIGFVELIGLNASGLFDAREALVISDSDDCLEFDLGHTGIGLAGPFDGTTCGDGVVEEVFIPFRTDRNDRSRVIDNDGCQPASKTRMQDDPSTTLPQLSNKAYLAAPPQDFPPGAINPLPVGPETEILVTDDCFGYGRDEDLPGLVVMVDVGAARVFDQNFDLVEVQPGVNRIRNLAGFVSTVTRELRDRFGRSHIVAHMQIERGMLEPLVAFDTRLAPTSPFISSEFQRRIDSGPIETFSWTTLPSPLTVTVAEVDQLVATLDDVTSVKVRAVLVEGEAPEFIDDLDQDGKYTMKDLILMGYTPLSNQAKRTINVLQQEKFEDFGGTIECPSFRVFVGVDFDGNNIGYSCEDGDGNSRSFKKLPE